MSISTSKDISDPKRILRILGFLLEVLSNSKRRFCRALGLQRLERLGLNSRS